MPGARRIGEGGISFKKLMRHACTWVERVEQRFPRLQFPNEKQDEYDISFICYMIFAGPSGDVTLCDENKVLQCLHADVYSTVFPFSQQSHGRAWP
jgi:hypothetical protein